jgi:hypothetical protein
MDVVVSTYKAYDRMFHTMLILDLITADQRIRFERYFNSLLRETI